MKNRLMLIGYVVFVFMIGSMYNLTFNVLRWNTTVTRGDVWVWDYYESEPFTLGYDRVDTIWVVAVKDGYVKAITRHWYSPYKIEVIYKKNLFNQNSFSKISK